MKKLLESFIKKNCKNENQTDFRDKKLIKKKVTNYMSNEKTRITLLTVVLIKKGVII